MSGWLSRLSQISRLSNDRAESIVKITDSAGRLIDYIHDDIGNLVQVILPENGALHYAYEDRNDPHNATTITDSSCSSCSGGAYTNTYDSRDRVIRQEHGDHVMTLSYDVP